MHAASVGPLTSRACRGTGEFMAPALNLTILPCDVTEEYQEVGLPGTLRKITSILLSFAASEMRFKRSSLTEIRPKLMVSKFKLKFIKKKRLQFLKRALTSKSKSDGSFEVEIGYGKTYRLLCSRELRD